MRKSWVLTACLLVASTAAAAPAAGQVRVERRGDLLELRWADAEERLQGTLHPAQPREGEPLTVSLHVGNFQGPEFDGPLTLTFHQVGSPSMQTLTLVRDGVNWHTQLTPDAPGQWELEVRYRRTHLKVLTARFTVASQPLPRYLGWGLVAVGAGLALALGLRGLLRRAKSSPADPPPQAPAPAGPGPVDPRPAATAPQAAAPAAADPRPASAAPQAPADAPAPQPPATAAATQAAPADAPAPQPPAVAAPATAVDPRPEASAPAGSGASAGEDAPGGSAPPAPAPADPATGR